MEFIKKVIKQITTTGTTTGCTGTCRVIIPDTGVTYNFKISLTQDAVDYGFFDTMVQNTYYTYIVVNEKYYSYLSGGTAYSDLDTVTVGTPPTEYSALKSLVEVPIVDNTIVVPETITTAPTVLTGLAYLSSPTAISMSITGNSVTNLGGLPVMEYGVLYSADVSTDSTLIYGGSLVDKKSTVGAIAVNTKYTKILTSLAGDSDIYYRAFAKNSKGIGYGEIKSKYYLGTILKPE